MVERNAGQVRNHYSLALVGDFMPVIIEQVGWASNQTSIGFLVEAGES
jgi:hypothetical protein